MYFKLLIVAAVLLAPSSILAGKLPGPDEALRVSFPEATFARDTLLLTEPEKYRAAELSGQNTPPALVSRYLIRQDGDVVAYAYLDKHKVRALPETLMVVLDAEGVLQKVHILAFREPQEYLPRAGWYRQFRGKTVDDEIRMKKNIDGVTGATLTSRATTQCARRVMAIHEVLKERTP